MCPLSVARGWNEIGLFCVRPLTANISADLLEHGQIKLLTRIKSFANVDKYIILLFRSHTPRNFMSWGFCTISRTGFANNVSQLVSYVPLHDRLQLQMFKQKSQRGRSVRNGNDPIPSRLSSLLSPSGCMPEPVALMRNLLIQNHRNRDQLNIPPMCRWNEQSAATLPYLIPTTPQFVHNSLPISKCDGPLQPLLSPRISVLVM